MTTYLALESMISATAEAVRPAERLSVSQAAEQIHYINLPGTHVGFYSYDKTPYAREWDDELQSLDFTGQIRVGPARCSKSAGFLNWTAFTAKCDPANMMAVHMTQSTARDWSKDDLAKMFRNSPEMRKRLKPGRQNDNTHDKEFLSGMRMRINHPSISELSGKTSPRNWLFDYDRMDQNIDGEGNPFDLTRKRAGTFRRFGMTVADASPGFPIQDTNWVPTSPHEAPPCEGILALYNRGDRRRWHWRCLQCHHSFEPDFKLLQWPASNDIMEAAEQVVMVCPHDGFPMTPDMKYELNLGGRWIKEGQIWTPDNQIIGVPRRGNICSFWLKGPAAGFSTWVDIVQKYLEATEEFNRTGSEEALKTTVNTDHGLPYLPKALETDRLPDQLKARAQPARRGEVIDGVRFLITTIDVQKHAWVCHTFGIEPIQAGDGWLFDIHHVDMWKETKSRRLDDDGHPKMVDPATYAEDWDILVEAVIERRYPLADGSGRTMGVKLVACDSGGLPSAKAARLNAARETDGPKVSVTSNAYEFWRRLKKDPLGRQHHLRFHLLKGEPSDTKPLLTRTMPDSLQKDKFAIARGDVPVWAVNSNQAKDQSYNLLGREEPGGQVHFPIWFDEFGNRIDIDWLYKQLTAEVRATAGWANPGKKRNEAFDLLAYLVAFFKHPDIRLEHIQWSQPPGWARPWDENDLVQGADEAPIYSSTAKTRDMDDIAEALG
jgi:phage terminase large subunit GpA-like protein